MKVGLFAVFLDIGDGVTNSSDFLGILVGNVHLEYTLKLHNQLYGVERVGAQVILEACLWLNLILTYTEFVNDNVPNFFFDFSHNTFALNVY